MAPSKKWIDYYKLLGVPTGASKQAIRSAFRKLALKIHPDKNKAADATEKFKELNQAYETLSNKDLKAEYDKSYKSKAKYAELGEFAEFYPHLDDSEFTPQDPPVYHDVFVTNEQLVRGCTKKMKICRRFYNKGKVIHSENKNFNVNVNPGCANNSTVTLSRGGDRYRHRIPADIIFVIKEKSPPSTLSRRKDSDVVYYNYNGFKCVSVQIQGSMPYGCAVTVKF